MPHSQESRIAPTKEDVLATERARTEGKEDVSIVTQRNCLTRSRFDLNNEFIHSKKNLKEQMGGLAGKLCPRECNSWRRRVLSLFPFIGIMRGYGRSDLFNDLIAGLTVGVMHIPQGMAYGFLANIDPVYGLYTTFFAVFVYFFFGTSRHISIGVFAVVSLMIGNVVDKSDCSLYLNLSKQATSNPTNTTLSNATHTTLSNATSAPVGRSTEALMEECKVQHALAVTFLVGLFQLLMGVMKIGFVTAYLSEPLTSAFTTGAAVHVISSQFKHVFGINPATFNGPFKIIYLYISLGREMVHVNWATLVTCVLCMAIISSMQRWVSPVMKKFFKVPLPSELIVMMVGTLISHYCNLSSPSVYHIKVLGKIPQGIPPPRSPDFRLLPEVALDAAAIAIVAFTINFSMASMFAAKHDYRLHSNQELIAYGVSNMVCSCFNCYVNAASLSRSLVQESTGGRTQIAGIISSLLLLLVLLFVGPLFHDLPTCILAAVIIVNLKGIFMQVFDLKYLRKISTSDSLTWIVTCLSVILLDVDLGLLVGLAFSFLTIVIRNQLPKIQVLGNIKETTIYVNVADYKNAAELAGVKIFSLSSSLFFANSEKFISTLKKIINKYNNNNNYDNNNNDNSDNNDNNDNNFNKNENDRIIFMNKNNNVDKNKVSLMEVEKKADSSDVTDNIDHNAHPLLSSTQLVEAPSNNVQASVGTELKRSGSADDDPPSSEMTTSIHHVILDCSHVTFIDVVGISALDSINRLLKERGIHLSLASCNLDVYTMLVKAMDLKKLEKCQVFVTLHDAVLCALA